MAKIKEGYKETEVGIIPNEWEVIKLKEIAEICYGKNQKSVETIEGKNKILGTGGVIGRTDSFLWDKPSVLIGRKGTINKPMYIDEPFWTVDTLFYTKINDGYLAKWLYYFLNFIDLSKYNEATGVPSLNTTTLNGIKIIVPLLSEQQRIAEILSTTDEHIEKLVKTIGAYQLLKKGMTKKLLTEGIGHTEFNDTEIGRIPKDWEVKRLDDVCNNISIGLVTSMTKNYADYGVPLIRNSDIKEGKILKENLIFLNREFANKNINRCLLEGDVVTVHTGDIGTSAVIGKELNGCQGFATINSRVNKSIVNECYYSYFLNSEVFKKQAYSVSTGDGRNNLNLKDFVNMLIAIPKDINEQVEITRNLDCLRNRLGLYQQEREDFIQLKKALMKKLLTGKIRVTQ
ncbi:MAG: restriction endonuclease subunit S [Clostridiaceae bacterium]|nr:restriction endonuclease subunit S [Clostridiaceae bacterium]